MKYSFLLAFLLGMMIPFTGFAQNDWRPGYVIRNQGDTLHGFIDFRDTKSNCAKCYFRKNMSAEPNVFTPDELRGYRFNDGLYFVTWKVADINSGQPVFLEYLLNGMVNLFHYRSDSDKFFIEKDASLIQLKDTRSVKKIDGLYYSQDNKEYVRQLNYLFQDASIQPEIDKSSFEAKSLIHLTQDYHNKVCKDRECIIYQWKKKPMHLQKVIYAGFLLDKLRFYETVTSGFSLGYQVGCRFKLENIYQWNEKLSISFDFALLYYSSFHLKAHKSYDSYITYQGTPYDLRLNAPASSSYGFVFCNTLDVKTKTMALNIPLSLDYTFSKGGTRPYAGIGLVNMLVITQNKDFVFQRFYDIYKKTFPVYNYGVQARGGISFVQKNNNEISLELDLEWTHNIETGLTTANNIFVKSGIGYGF